MMFIIPSRMEQPYQSDLQDLLWTRLDWLNGIENNGKGEMGETSDKADNTVASWVWPPIVERWVTK